MKKRLQIALSDEAWSAVEGLAATANSNFDSGSISLSDVINEMILCSNVDVEALKLKHTNIRKSLRLLATREDLDVDLAIKSLMALKNGKKTKTKKPKAKNEGQECLSV